MNLNVKILQPDHRKALALSESLGVSPEVAKILLNRGIKTVEEGFQFINGSLETLYDPFLMGGVPEAVNLILPHLEKSTKILIHGDYDADGVTSTAIMKKALTRLGAEVECYIPDRFDEGYGFSEEAVQLALEHNIGLIITVDCGSSNCLEVRKAKESGIDVIITDHHEVPADCPVADAFINLKKPGETYPFHELSGAGVALKLITALYEKLGRSDWRDFLDLAAVGTVADVVPLVGENRVIVKEGLKLLEQRKRPGIDKLLEQANVRREQLSPWDISFIIAPRINAAGRLADATNALNLLLEEDPEKAREMAVGLFSLNQERQQVEGAMKEEIEQIINDNPEILSEPVWVFSRKGWHQGVIGIVASRFSQTYKRPVYLISIDEKGEGRGSARCSENYNIYQALCESGHLLLHFGGHRLAGGFSVPEENIPALKQSVSRPHLFSSGQSPVLADMALEGEKITLDLARSLMELAPFGEGNPKPVFLTRRVRFQSVSQVGAKGQHLKFWVAAGGRDIKGIAFGMGDREKELLSRDLYYDILYNLDVDSWGDNDEASIKLIEIIPPDPPCERVMRGLEEIGKDSADREDSCPWRLVDSRQVINRHRYIENLSRRPLFSVVLTRNNRQMRLLQKNLQKEGIPCRILNGDQSEIPADQLLIMPFDRAEVRLPVEELVFYHPPHQWECFKWEIFQSPGLKRVHLLFGDQDVLREEANQEILSPDRDKLLKIFSVIKKLTGSGTGLIRPDQLAERIGDDLIQGITVRIALRIFSEIGLIQSTPGEEGYSVSVSEQEKQDLTLSPTYNSQIIKKENFSRMKKLYMDPFLDQFRESLSKVLNSNYQGDEEYGCQRH